MFCNKCGKKLEDGCKFCNGCGAPIQVVAPAPAAMATPAAPIPAAPAAIPAAPAAPAVTPAPVSTPVNDADIPEIIKKLQKERVEKERKLIEDIAPVKKKKSKGGIIATIIAVIIAIAIGGFILYQKNQQERSEEVKKMLKSGDRYLQDMDYDEAISVYQEIIELDKTNADAYVGLAKAYIGNRDYYSALEALINGLDNVSEEDADELEELLEEVQDIIDVKADFSGVVVAGDDDIVYGNNEPLEGVRVSIESIDIPKEYSYSESAVTDKDGKYEFEDLHLGSYEITFERDGYVDVKQNLEVYPGQDVATNQVVEMIDKDDAGTGSASGIVIDAKTGMGVEELTINLREGYNSLDGKVVATTHTNDYGEYLVEDVPSGIYTAEIVDERDVKDPYTGGLMIIKIIGGTKVSDQNGYVSEDLNPGQIRIVMSWGQYPYDLDSHLWVKLDSGDNGHVWFEDMIFGTDKYDVANLDLDDINSYGPETVTVYDPQPGEYVYGVYNYWHSSDDELPNSGAIVQVYVGNSLTPSYTFYVPKDKGYYWEVFTYDPETLKITTVNKVYQEYTDAGHKDYE